MKSPNDAIVLCNHLIANLGKTDFEDITSHRMGLLNFVVAGGGFTRTRTLRLFGSERSRKATLAGNLSLC